MNGAGYSVQAASPLSAGTDGGSPLPMGGPVGNTPTPPTGIFRLFHVPDWLSDFSGYTFSGPTFFPVDCESPDAPTHQLIMWKAPPF
jgi:hypothetical protein